MPPPELRLEEGTVPRGLKGLVEAIEGLVGAALPRVGSSREGVVLVGDRRRAARRLPSSGRAALWVERTSGEGRQAGVVRTMDSSGAARDFPFEAMASARFWSDRAAFEATAARRILDVLGRAPEAPWPVPAPGSAWAPEPLWKSLLRRPCWGLGTFDGARGWRTLRREPANTLADPFPLMHAGREWLFFEHQRPGAPGRIAVGAVEGGSLTEIVEIDLGPTHRSWPNVFHHRGDLWMIPESGADGEVALWRCQAFPDRWSKERVLLAGAAWTDPVLFEEGGLWWLFVSGSGPAPNSHSDSLHLFHSPDPWRGDFTAHPWNPVSVGVVGSRPAGRVFREDGRLVRPAQDCSGRYGRALEFRSIDRLTPTEYLEGPLRRIDPPGVLGLHTWNQGSSGVFVDLLASETRRPFASGR